MPHKASELQREEFDRVWVLGEPHIGKSTTVAATAAKAFGLGYVINCGKKTGLADAQRRTTKFEYDIVRDEKQMDEAIKVGRNGCKDGIYKWVMLDDFNLYASWLEGALEDESRNSKGEADGRKFWREYRKRLVNILIRLMDIRGHFYCVSHFVEYSAQTIDGQMEKNGVGIAPMFAGAARKELPGMFADIVLMRPDPDDDSQRVFSINPKGVYGPSCLSLPGTRDIDADMGKLHEAFVSSSKTNGVAKQARA